MQFLPYQQIREQEVLSGHDLVLGSCLNLAGGPETEDGAATYLGQAEDLSRVFLMMSIHGDATLVDQSGNILLSSFDPQEHEKVLARYSWLYPY